MTSFPDLSFVLLVVIGFFSFFRVVMPLVVAVTARYETRYLVDQLKPAFADDLEKALPYWLANRSAAAELGLIECGDFELFRRSSLASGFVSLRMTAEHTTLVAIEGGYLAKMRHRRTILKSLAEDGTLFESQDEVGATNVSEIKDTAVLVNAHLPELLDFHLKRVEATGKALTALSPQDGAKLYEELERREVESMIGQGLAEYAEPGGGAWHFTWKGAFRLGFAGQSAQLAMAKKQRDRFRQARPGD